jgi:hypothetical protein
VDLVREEEREFFWGVLFLPSSVLSLFPVFRFRSRLVLFVLCQVAKKCIFRS